LGGFWLSAARDLCLEAEVCRSLHALTRAFPLLAVGPPGCLRELYPPKGTS